MDDSGRSATTGSSDLGGGATSPKTGEPIGVCEVESVGATAGENQSQALSLIERLALADPETRSAFYRTLSEPELHLIPHLWRLWARPAQLEPQCAWSIWLLLTGRGFGKTRTGSEQVRKWATGQVPLRIGLVGRTAADVRDTMLNSKAGLLNIGPIWERPKWEPSKRLLTWPNGSIAHTYSADEPAQLRGPEHHKVWGDEYAEWNAETWENLQFGLRLDCEGGPQVVLTSTPKPKHYLKDLLDQAALDPSIVLTRGSSYDNRSNLSPVWFSRLIKRYEGTALGMQEIEGRLIDQHPNALWTRDSIERWYGSVAIDALERIVVAVDPSVGDPTTAKNPNHIAEAGIVVAGSLGDRLFILEDCTTRGAPHEWLGAAVQAYWRWSADALVGEINNGGKLIEELLRTVPGGANVHFKAVRASDGKRTRAEPLSGLYRQGRVHHCRRLGDLEDQMVNWVPGMKSPDRLDALVWAGTELALGTGFDFV